MPPAIDVLNRLTPADVEAVLGLVDEVTDADSMRPLSEHVMLHLRYGGDTDARHLVAREDGRVIGYAHVDVTDKVAGASAELTVAPRRRGRGIGTKLAATARDVSPDGRIRLWAHGGHPAAAVLADRLGLRRHRVLWQMRRSLYGPLPEPNVPEGVAVRTFRPGEDEERWLKVNARAFADHPEQGKWTADDLAKREKEPWFDPAGFFLAERDGSLVGFHWTKVHGETSHGHEPIGEVYVVGIDPDAQGSGLGKALTLVGLRHLRRRGLASVMLYVDESNEGAIRVYTSLGFARWDIDVCYASDGAQT